MSGILTLVSVLAGLNEELNDDPAFPAGSTPGIVEPVPALDAPVVRVDHRLRHP